MSNLVKGTQTQSKLLFEEESYKILGVCITVHKKMGAGFQEDVYEEVLQREFIKNKIPFEKKKQLPLYYEGYPLQKYFIADFVCYDKIILDIKSIHFIHNHTKQQVVNLLKATNFQLGLLINFGEPSLKWKRLIHTVEA